MRLSVTLEHRFAITPDGAAWTSTMFPREFWDRYLDVFEGLTVVARALPAAAPDPSWRRVDGDGVGFAPLPHYIGPVQYLRRRAALTRSLREALSPDAAVVMRVGSPIADLAAPMLLGRGQPFAVEVVGDPWDTFAPGAMRHPLRPVMRRYFARKLREQCAAACAASYVTAAALQRRYPPGPRTYATDYSSIRLTGEDFAAAARGSFDCGGPLRLATVGTLAQMYKGTDVLLTALAECVRERGLDLSLTIVGDGRHRGELEALASSLDVADRVDFRGQLPAGAAVRGVLDETDLFLLPSLQEGLPRALIEAMARGLPCLASDVGGIGELLAAEDLLPAGDAGALAGAIAAAAGDPARLARMAARNFERAGDYRDEVLAARRRGLYEHLRDRTAEWIAARKDRR